MSVDQNFVQIKIEDEAGEFPFLLKKKRVNTPFNKLTARKHTH